MSGLGLRRGFEVRVQGVGMSGLGLRSGFKVEASRYRFKVVVQVIGCRV